MKSIFKIFFLTAFVGAVAVPTVNTVSVFTNAVADTQYQYLIAGLDDAAKNTDVLIVVSYDTESNEAAVLQIPRDTYCNFGGNQNKINQLYAHFLRQEGSSESAMQMTSDFIGEIFGISFDGYIAITTKAFRNAVDSIGGVWVNLPEGFTYSSSNKENSFVLSKGENLLDGKKAETFVRHRKSYAMGDLGRIDAQKIFFGGLYTTLTERVGFDKLISLALSLDKGVVTDFSFTEAVAVLIKNFSRLKKSEITYVTVPGKSFCESGGTWYYVLNKKACEELFSKKVLVTGRFDPYGWCTDVSDPGIDKIYNESDITYREYSQGEVEGIRIPRSAR